MSDIVSEQVEEEIRRQERRERAGFAASAAPKIDRLPPHSPDAEMGVLGCIFLSPADCLDECIPVAGSIHDFFYDSRHQTLFGILAEMHEDKKPIDTITVIQLLKDRNQLDDVGGVDYLAKLPDAVPSAANLSYYLDIVLEKYTFRKLVHTCTNVVGNVYDYQGTANELMDLTERKILDIRRHLEPQHNQEVKPIADAVMAELEAELAGDGGPLGLSTGFRDLDRITMGLLPDDTVIIAARPSGGKTSLAMNIAENVAVDQGIPVGIFTLEMSGKRLMRRMIFSRAGVTRRAFRDKLCTEEQLKAVVKAHQEIRSAPLYIEDQSNIDILTLRSKARRMVRKYGIKLLVVDYLQLVQVLGIKLENRQQAIAEISRGIKTLGKDLGIPIILLSQLNRDIEKGKPRKPVLADLRESGAIEQDADLVILLYPKWGDDQPAYGSVVNIGAILAKQRDGEQGEISFVFNKPITRFQNANSIEHDDVPDAQPAMAF